MGFLARFTHWACTPKGGEGQFGENYQAMQDYAGRHMAAWDTRGVNATIAGNELDVQPGVGFANGVLRMIDPDWNPR